MLPFLTIWAIGLSAGCFLGGAFVWTLAPRPPRRFKRNRRGTSKILRPVTKGGRRTR